MNKLTPKQIQEIDQSTALYIDLVVPVVKRLYDGLSEAGIPKEIVSLIIQKITVNLMLSFLGTKK